MQCDCRALATDDEQMSSMTVPAASLAFTVQRNKKPQLHYTLHVILQEDNYKAKGVSLEQPIFSNHDEL
jgi:hypothetical protein